MSVAYVLPPLPAGEGWGGVLLQQELNPLPASPCKQGEERAR